MLVEVDEDPPLITVEICGCSSPVDLVMVVTVTVLLVVAVDGTQATLEKLLFEEDCEKV